MQLTNLSTYPCSLSVTGISNGKFNDEGNPYDFTDWPFPWDKLVTNVGISSSKSFKFYEDYGSSVDYDSILDDFSLGSITLAGLATDSSKLINLAKKVAKNPSRGYPVIRLYTNGDNIDVYRGFLAGFSVQTKQVSKKRVVQLGIKIAYTALL